MTTHPQHQTFADIRKWQSRAIERGVRPTPEVVFRKLQGEYDEWRALDPRSPKAGVELADMWIVSVQLAAAWGFDGFGDERPNGWPGALSDNAMQRHLFAAMSDVARAVVFDRKVGRGELRYLVDCIEEAARFYGHDLPTIRDAKMAKNRRRQWYHHGDGTAQHVDRDNLGPDVDNEDFNKAQQRDEMRGDWHD